MNWIFGGRKEEREEKIRDENDPPLNDEGASPSKNQGRYGKVPDPFDVIESEKDRENIKKFDELLNEMIEKSHEGEIITLNIKKKINTANPFYYIICYQWDNKGNLISGEVEDPFLDSTTKISVKFMHDFWKSCEGKFNIQDVSMNPIGIYVKIEKQNLYQANLEKKPMELSKEKTSSSSSSPKKTPPPSIKASAPPYSPRNTTPSIHHLHDSHSMVNIQNPNYPHAFAPHHPPTVSPPPMDQNNNYLNPSYHNLNGAHYSHTPLPHGEEQHQSNSSPSPFYPPYSHSHHHHPHHHHHYPHDPNLHHSQRTLSIADSPDREQEELTKSNRTRNYPPPSSSSDHSYHQYSQFHNNKGGDEKFKKPSKKRRRKESPTSYLDENARHKFPNEREDLYYEDDLPQMSKGTQSLVTKSFDSFGNHSRNNGDGSVKFW